jgi:hypothetical protein
MKYWYAPLLPEPRNLFSTQDNYKNPDPLFVGEISKDIYDRIMANRNEPEIDEFGLPLTDEFGLPQ